MKSRVVVAAIIQKGNKLLFGKKPKNIGPFPNQWIILGGGVDLDKETLEEALIREIREEANIEITDIKKISFAEDYEPDKKGEMTHYLFIDYLVKYKSGTAKANDDVAEIKWIDKSDIKNIPLSRPTIKLFKELHWA